MLWQRLKGFPQFDGGLKAPVAITVDGFDEKFRYCIVQIRAVFARITPSGILVTQERLQRFCFLPGERACDHFVCRNTQGKQVYPMIGRGPFDQFRR